MAIQIVCDQCGGTSEVVSVAGFGPAGWRRVSGHTSQGFRSVDYCSAECQVLGAESFDPPDRQEAEDDPPEGAITAPRLTLVDPLPHDVEAPSLDDLPVAEVR